MRRLLKLIYLSLLYWYIYTASHPYWHLRRLWHTLLDLYFLIPVGGGIALLRHQQALNQKNIQRICILLLQTIHLFPLSGAILLVTVYDKWYNKGGISAILWDQATIVRTRMEYESRVLMKREGWTQGRREIKRKWRRDLGSGKEESCIKRQ